MAVFKHFKSISTAFAVAAQLAFAGAQAHADAVTAPSHDVYSRFLANLDSCSALLPQTLEADASNKSVSCSKSSFYKSCSYSLTQNERQSTKVEITLGIDSDKISTRFFTTNGDILNVTSDADGLFMRAYLGAGTKSKDITAPQGLEDLSDLPQRDRDFANSLIEYGITHRCRLQAG